MKKLSLLLILVGVCSAQSLYAKTNPNAPFTSEDDKFSYIIGLNMAQNFKSQGINVKPELVARGLGDGYAGKKPLINAQEQQQIINDMQQKIQKQQAGKATMSADANSKLEAKFLSENKNKKGVITTASGLQYEVIREGKGEQPKNTDTVNVNYEGKLLDGTVFDSSYKRGQPISFGVNQVIPGWTEALKLMKPGAEYMLYIPANLAYGQNGIPNVIPPNSMLIFKVELLSVQGK